jgi:hypothetical protein
MTRKTTPKKNFFSVLIGINGYLIGGVGIGFLYNSDPTTTRPPDIQLMVPMPIYTQ